MRSIGINNIAGVAGTTLSGIVTVTTSVSHNLAVGNKIKDCRFSWISSNSL